MEDAIAQHVKAGYLDGAVRFIEPFKGKDAADQALTKEAHFLLCR